MFYSVLRVIMIVSHWLILAILSHPPVSFNILLVSLLLGSLVQDKLLRTLRVLVPRWLKAVWSTTEELQFSPFLRPFSYFSCFVLYHLRPWKSLEWAKIPKVTWLNRIQLCIVQVQ
jgi:hypothetical protein